MPELAVLIPTRGRPENVRKVISAWDFTNAWDHADMVLVADADDPEIQGYRDLVDEDGLESIITLIEIPAWLPMVHKLNAAARDQAAIDWPSGYFALAFAGDDHLPQTIGWAKRYLDVLRELGTGMVYGDDGYQGRKLSTEWAITSDVVRALGRMVPADVEHMYCDNAMMDLFGAAGALRHLPEVRIEHMHPVAGKAETDDQYNRVNHRDQFSKDRRSYQRWLDRGRAADVALVRQLRKGLPDVPAESHPTPRVARTAGSGPRPIQRSGPSAVRRGREPGALRVPRHFRQVRAATPEDVMTALADFAAQVPVDQEIVELGVFQGRTALQLAWGAGQGQGAHVTAIDPWDLPGNVYDPPFTDAESRGWAHHWVSSLGYADKIRLVQGFSQDVVTTWTDEPRIGLLYVDGDHTKEGARRDIELWATYLAPGARIAVDDYGHPDWPGVGEAVDELVAEGFLEPVQLYHDRLAVTRLTDVIERTDPVPTITAMTSEGVIPSPYPAVDGQTTEEPVVVRHVDAGPVLPTETVELPEVDTEVSTEWAWKVTPEEAITLNLPLGPVADLNTTELRALAKGRGIVLGARKDKRDAMLQALRDGR